MKITLLIYFIIIAFNAECQISEYIRNNESSKSSYKLKFITFKERTFFERCSFTIPEKLEKYAFDSLNISLTSTSDSIQYLKGISNGFKNLLIDKNIKYYSINEKSYFEKGRKEGINLATKKSLNLSLYDFGFEYLIIEGFIGSMYPKFEESEFKFLGCNESGWIKKVSFTDKQRTLYHNLRKQKSRDQNHWIYIRAKSFVSKKSDFHGLRKYGREVLLTDIIEIRNSTKDEIEDRRNFEKNCSEILKQLFSKAKNKNMVMRSDVLIENLEKCECLKK